GPVCRVTSVWPSIAVAAARTSSGERARRTPPLPAGSSRKCPAPRPPAWICDFITHTEPPSFAAAVTASSGVQATWPGSTATPNSFRSSFAWYSWMFMRSDAELLERLDQIAHGGAGFVEGGFLGGGELHLDDFLDAVFADHHGHADIEVFQP